MMPIRPWADWPANSPGICKCICLFICDSLINCHLLIYLIIHVIWYKMAKGIKQRCTLQRIKVEINAKQHSFHSCNVKRYESSGEQSATFEVAWFQRSPLEIACMYILYVSEEWVDENWNGKNICLSICIGSFLCQLPSTKYDWGYHCDSLVAFYQENIVTDE